jgi:uncharacterized protein (UPF0332 family)
VTWPEISDDNWTAANLLSDQGHHRSSISRAYYAAYAIATEALVGMNVQFAADRDGPSHAQLPAMILSNLGLGWSVKYNVRRALLRLYMARVNADYRTVTVDDEAAKMALRDANLIRQTLGS